MKRIEPSVYESLAAFRFALRRFLAFSEAVTAAAGVTSQQYQGLLVIKTWEGEVITIGDFANAMLLQPNGAVQMIDRLAAAGFAERRESPSDRRSVLVSLTAKGATVLATLAGQHIAALLGQEPLLAEALARLRMIGKDAK